MTSLKEAFLSKYPKYNIILTMFEEANECQASWGNLSKIRLQKFVDYMGERISPNSVRQYCAKLKAVLNLYNEEVSLPKDYQRVLSIKQERSTNIWLNDSDLEKLIDYEPKNENERLVKGQFLIGCFSGCRHSDFSQLSETNIMDGMLSYVSQKTKIQATVPLKPIVAKLLKETPKKEVSDVSFNDILRRICHESGITERVKIFKAGKIKECEKYLCISSHSARRSFATNLYLRGADLYSISRMMGHSSVEMTSQNYICCGLRDQSPEVMEYFK